MSNEMTGTTKLGRKEKKKIKRKKLDLFNPWQKAELKRENKQRRTEVKMLAV